MFNKSIVIGGAGGHGVMFLGKILSLVALKKNLNVTYFPSYGIEVRGGSAYCYVSISQKGFTSPLPYRADVGIIFNQPSFERFCNFIKDDGYVLINSGLCSPSKILRENVKFFFLDVSQLSLSLEDNKVMNIIMLGAISYLEKRLFPFSIVKDVLKDMFVDKKVYAHELRAFELGFQEARKHFSL